MKKYFIYLLKSQKKPRLQREAKATGDGYSVIALCLVLRTCDHFLFLRVHYIFQHDQEQCCKKKSDGVLYHFTRGGDRVLPTPRKNLPKDAAPCSKIRGHNFPWTSQSNQNQPNQRTRPAPRRRKPSTPGSRPSSTRPTVIFSRTRMSKRDLTKNPSLKRSGKAKA